MQISCEIRKMANLKPNVPNEYILRRLGFGNKDNPPAKIANLIAETTALAYSLCESRGAFKIIKIVSNTEKITSLENKTVFHSENISRFLRNCRYAALMFAVAGKEITNTIKEYTENGKMTEAVILDAAASEIVDAALDEIQKYISHSAKKYGLKMKYSRFSPGYGDFVLENQKIFFDLLEMREAGISLSKTFQLIPEKTVTAITGLK